MDLKKNIPKYLFFLIILSAVIGILFSAYLLHHHILFSAGNITGKSMCAISETFDCDAVDASPYSEFAGFPIASFGIIFYLIIIFLALLVFVRNKAFLEIAVVHIALLSALSIIYSIFLAYVSIAIIKSICLFCVITYLCNIGIFASSWLWAKRCEIAFWPTLKTKTFQNPLNQNGLVLNLYFIFLLSLICLSLITTRVTQKRFGVVISNTSLERFFTVFDNLPQSKINIEGSPFRGNPDSKVVLVAFSDFQCPFCRLSELTLDSILHQFKDSIKFVFKQYPLDSSCNPYIKNSLHASACISAKASICAGKQNRFWEYHDYLFLTARKFDQKSLTRYASILGLDSDQFTTCLEQPEQSESILRDIEQARELRIRGTPTFFLNGRMLSNLTPKVWVKLLQREVDSERLSTDR